MKYTNKHIKKLILPYKVLFTIFSIVLGLGIILLLFGFIAAGNQMNNVDPLEEVLAQYSNPANKTAYLEIIEIPQRIAEDKYEVYYLVRTESETYISGMQEEQYEALKKEIEENGKAKLEGMTNVIIDESVLKNVAVYLNSKHIHLRVTKLSYGGILKEGYIVNLILGGIFTFLSLVAMFGSASQLKRYRNPLAKQIDEECNRQNAKWLENFEIYLTDSFLVSTYADLTTVDLDKISSVILHDTEQGNVIMDIRKTDGSTIKVFEKSSKYVYIYENEKNYMEEIFGSKNINFVCETEILNDDEPEYEDDMERV